MSSFKQSAIIVSNKSGTVTPTISGDLSIVARNNRLQVFDGTSEQQLAYLSDVSGGPSGNFVTTDTEQSIYATKTFLASQQTTITGDAAWALNSDSFDSYTELTWTYASHSLLNGGASWTDGHYWSIFGYTDGVDLLTIDTSGKVTIPYTGLALLYLPQVNNGNFLTYDANNVVIDSGYNSSNLATKSYVDLADDDILSQVALTSGGLQDRISTIETFYAPTSVVNSISSQLTLLSTTALLSGSLQSQINSEISNRYAKDATITGGLGIYALNSYVQSTSAALQSQINSEITARYSANSVISGGLGIYALNSYVQSTSASLQSQIFNRATYSEVQVVTASLQSQVNSEITARYSANATISGGLGIYALNSYVQSTSAALQSQIFNRITNSEINGLTGQLTPLVTTTLLTSNLQNQINQKLSTVNAITAHNSLFNLQGGTSSEYYHLTNAQFNDYVGRSNVNVVSGAAFEAKLASYTNLSTIKNTGGDIVLNNTTSFNISAGYGIVVDHDVVVNGYYPQVSRVLWGDITNNSITQYAASGYSFVYVGISGSNFPVLGIPYITPRDWTEEERRKYILLGKVNFRLGTINAIRNIQYTGIETYANIADLSDAIGTLNLNGNDYSASSTNLTIKKSAGSSYRFATNTELNTKQPSQTTDNSIDPVIFRYVYQNGTDPEIAKYTSLVANICGDIWDDGSGILQSVSANNWTIQRIYFFPISNTSYIFAGQQQYTSQDAALVNLSQEDFNIPDDVMNGASFRGWVVIKQGITNVADTSAARFIKANKFGAAGGGSGSVPSHNALSGLQGGGTNEYFHLTSSQSRDYVGLSTVSAVSGKLTPLTVTAALTANLQAQILNLTAGGLQGTGQTYQVGFFSQGKISGSPSFTYDGVNLNGPDNVIANNILQVGNSGSTNNMLFQSVAGTGLNLNIYAPPLTNYRYVSFPDADGVIGVTDNQNYWTATQFFTNGVYAFIDAYDHVSNNYIFNTNTLYGTSTGYWRGLNSSINTGKDYKNNVGLEAFRTAISVGNTDTTGTGTYELGGTYGFLSTITTNSSGYMSSATGTSNAINLNGANSTIGQVNLLVNSMDAAATNTKINSAYGNYSEIKATGNNASITSAFGVYQAIIAGSSSTINIGYGYYLASNNALTPYGIYINPDVPSQFNGQVRIAGSNASRSSLRLAQGTAPSAAVNGDIWVQPDGLYYQHNSTVEGPLVAGASSALIAGTSGVLQTNINSEIVARYAANVVISGGLGIYALNSYVQSTSAALQSQIFNRITYGEVAGLTGRGSTVSVTAINTLTAQSIIISGAGSISVFNVGANVIVISGGASVGGSGLSSGEVAGLTGQLTPLVTTQLLTSNLQTQLNNIPRAGALGIVIDGGGSVISTGFKQYIVAPYNCYITDWTILSTLSGEIVIDVWKDTYANFPPNVSDTIAGSEKPTLSGAVKNQNTTLTSWTKNISANDIIGFNVDSVSTIQKVILTLNVRKA
jgi:hypothetical protein